MQDRPPKVAARLTRIVAKRGAGWTSAYTPSRTSPLVSSRMHSSWDGGQDGKRAINRTVGRSGAGAFRLPVMQKAEKLGADVLLVNPRHASLKCSLYGYTDKKNRPGRYTFHCVWWGDESYPRH